MEVIAIIVSMVLFLGICLTFFLPTSPKSTRKEDTSPSLTTIDFIPNQMYQDNATGSGIALNEETRTLCLLKSVNTSPRLRSCTELLGSILVKNGSLMEKKWRTGSEQALAIMRGLEDKVIATLASEGGPPSQRQLEQKIDLCVVFNTHEDPIHIVNFLDMDAKEGGVIYEKALNSAKHWHTILSNLIDQASEMEFAKKLIPEHAQEGTIGTLPEDTSAAEALTRLSLLLDRQLITQEEFDTQKEKLLALK